MEHISDLKASTKFNWFVVVNYDGISHYEYRDIGDIVSRHHTNERARESANRSDKWRIAHVSELTN